MASKPKPRTIVAQNKEHILFKLFSGRVVTINKVVRQIDKGYKYYDLKNAEISYLKKDNKVFLRSIGDSRNSNNLESVPVTDIKSTRSLLFRYRKRGTIIAQNPEHNLFKLYSGRVVTKQHIVKQINKGHKFYDLKNAKITYFTVGDDTFLRSTSDGTTKNNLVEVPNVILSLNKKTVHKSSAIKERLYIKSHQRKVLATILIGSILLAGTAAVLCATLIKCHGSDVPPGPPTPPSPPVKQKIDGSNWQGQSAGTLEFTPDETNHTVTYTGNLEYAAHDLVIPSRVIDLNDVEYAVIEIDVMAFWGCSGLTGGLTISNGIQIIEDAAFTSCNGLNGDLTIGTGVQTIGDQVFEGCKFRSLTNAIGRIGSSNYYVRELGGAKVLLEGESAYDGRRAVVGNVAIGDGLDLSAPAITTICDNAFHGCSSLTGNLIIGDNVEMIGNEAFANCSGLNGVLTIGDSVMMIGHNAFINCTSLNGNLEIPNSVTAIGENAFDNCVALTGDLTIPNSITTIGYAAFLNLGCPNVYLDSAWTYTDFTTWYNGGTPTNNFTTGTQTWTTGHVYVDGSQMTW